MVKQVVQDNRSRQLRVIEGPAPDLGADSVLVRTAYSLISSGTERSKASLTSQSLLGKARARPDLVKQVIATARREGVGSTYRKVTNRLGEPGLLGYSLAGHVIAVGNHVQEFRVGDAVACGGATYANHAEVVSVPRTLTVPVPAGLSLRRAAFATVGAIALHGFRRSRATLGERVGIIGLGLVGQLAAQIAAAAGCIVFGADINPGRVELARSLGMTGVLTGEQAQVDRVIVCASARSDEPLRTAVASCRDRGTIVVVGDVPIVSDREPLYRKELELLLSRSYGPGRYDRQYEELGVDYPIAYVRWTEGRNMAAVLELLQAERLAVDPLISSEFAIDDAVGAYESLSGSDALAVMLRYEEPRPPEGSKPVPLTPRAKARDTVAVALIGAGNFARDTLIPALQEQKQVTLAGVMTGKSASAVAVAERYAVPVVASSVEELLDQANPDAVVVATRHHLHAGLATTLLARDRYVYLEKPLALTLEELDSLRETTSAEQRQRLMVGFNRRFAPLSQKLSAAVQMRTEPLVMTYRVNAGYIARDHWVQTEEGGGRIRGEACHFFDLLGYLAGAPISLVSAIGAANGERYSNDNVVLALGFSDGSAGTVIYSAAGHKSRPKERLDVHWGGNTAELEDFTGLDIWRAGATRPDTTRSGRDKGHRAAVAAFIDAARRGAASPLPFSSALNTTLATLAAEQSLRTGLMFAIDDDAYHAL